MPAAGSSFFGGAACRFCLRLPTSGHGYSSHPPTSAVCPGLATELRPAQRKSMWNCRGAARTASWGFRYIHRKPPVQPIAPNTAGSGHRAADGPQHVTNGHYWAGIEGASWNCLTVRISDQRIARGDRVAQLRASPLGDLAPEKGFKPDRGTAPNAGGPHRSLFPPLKPETVAKRSAKVRACHQRPCAHRLKVPGPVTKNS